MAAAAPTFSADTRAARSDLHVATAMMECVVEYLRGGCGPLDGAAVAEVMRRAGVHARQSGVAQSTAGFEGVLKRIPRYHALLKTSADTACRGSSKRSDGSAALESLFAKELHYTSRYREGHFRAAVFTAPPAWTHAGDGVTAPAALVLLPPDHGTTRAVAVFLPTGVGSADGTPHAAGTPAFLACKGLKPAQAALLVALGAAAAAGGNPAALLHAPAYHVTVLRRRASRGASAGGATVGAGPLSVGSVPSLLGPGPGPGSVLGSPWRPSGVGAGVAPAGVPPPQAVPSPQPAGPRRVRVGRRAGRSPPGPGPGPGPGPAAGGAWHLGDTVAYADGSIPWASPTAATSAGSGSISGHPAPVEAMRVSAMAPPVQGAVRAGQAAAALVGTLGLPAAAPAPSGLPSPGRPGSARALGEVIAATWSSLGDGGATEQDTLPWADSPAPPVAWTPQRSTGTGQGAGVAAFSISPPRASSPGTPASPPRPARSQREPLLPPARAPDGGVVFDPPESPPRSPEQRDAFRRYAALRAKKAREDASRKRAWAARRAAQELARDSAAAPPAPVALPVTERALAPAPAPAGAGGGAGAGAGSPSGDLDLDGGTLARTASRGGASNAARLRNALRAVCLAGPNRREDLEAALAAMKEAEAGPGGRECNFVVLFRSPTALLYRGLYAYHLPSDTLTRIHGRGPPALPPGAARDKRVRGYFKYSTGSRTFGPLPTRALTVTTDGLSLALPPSHVRPPGA